MIELEKKIRKIMIGMMVLYYNKSFKNVYIVIKLNELKIIKKKIELFDDEKQFHN